jgi:hypothetical protein
VLVYLHGFNSSPQSHKARVLERYMEERGLAARCACPALAPLPSEAIATCEALLARRAGAPVCFVGSSLGGFYATHLAEKHDARAILINPAIDPHVGLRAYLGTQKNLHTGEPYELTERHLKEWEMLLAPHVTPSRYLLVVETGDEVLDYRRAVQRYAGARQMVIPGGDHSLQSFSEHLPAILDFADRAA